MKTRLSPEELPGEEARGRPASRISAEAGAGAETEPLQPPGVSGPASGKLEAVQRGENVEPEIHPEVFEEERVLEVDGFSFWYGDKQALFDINMPIPKGKITAIIGPSGCGKSTLLRSINRLNGLLADTRHQGDILLNGDSVYDRSVDVIQLRKRMGMVFQKSNPFPMSIFENVVYPLRVDGERDKRLLEEICVQSLKGSALWDEVEDRIQDSALGLSGGQQQRLCIARAIAGEPEVLLMDEPCSALDPVATIKIEDLMHDLKGEYSIVIVTHNMQQASRVSDYCAFMYLGRLIEYGPTEKLFRNPILPETADYVSGRFG